MDFAFSSTRIAAQLEKIRHIQRGYRQAADYGTRNNGYDADASDDAVSDHQSEGITDDIDDEDTCDHVDTESEGLGCTKCGDAPCDGPDLSGSGHYMSDTESDDEARTSDSASEVSDGDCGDNEKDIMEDCVCSDYLRDIQEEYRALASIDPHGYEPLRHERREIRLLFIMPREFRLVTGRELVSCFTVVQRLDTAEPFTGLSYVWGDEKETLPILLNNKVVQVTRNLAAALRHIEHDRGRWGVRVFWVDALCINQKVNPEKSHQVQMMRDIYQRATRVFAWLGRATRLTVLVFRWMKRSMAKLASRYESNNPGRVLGQDLRNIHKLHNYQPFRIFTDVYREFMTEIVRSQHVRLFIEVIKLCNNPYWQRIWILQEMSRYSSVRIHLGCNSIELWYVDLFCLITQAAWRCHHELSKTRLAASPWHFSSDIRSQQHVAKPLRSTRIVERALKGQPLFFMLTDTMGPKFSATTPYFQSTKPEDRVYALLGLAGDATDLGLTPDYSKGVKEIYTETASSILLVHGTLNLLSFSQVPKVIEGLPSWVPDWSMVLPAWPLRCFLRSLWDRLGVSEACLKQTGQILHIDGNKLILPGVVVDIVHSTLINQNLQYGVHRGWLDKEDVREKQEFMVSALEFIHHHTSNPTRSFAIEINTFDALYHICLLNSSLERPAGASYGLFEFVRDYEALMESQWTRPISDLVFQLMVRTQSYAHFGRRIFATTRGFIGLGPAQVQEGDAVVILHGGKIPFLLRPVKDGRQGHYELMGEAYMYGMMEGEFMWTNPPTQEFTLV